MRGTPFPSVVRHLHRLVGLAGAEEATDRQLLERFAARRDEAAFATLVRRHGGLVRGVCGRVLRQAHDIDDVFQATFLVLARKAASLPWRDSVSGWLYQVAYRLAVELRARTARRRALEKSATALARPATADGGIRELGTVLDEELQRLPEKYRAPLLLCYLEGKTRDQAAQGLGWSLRTLERRLESGRVLLRARLTGRGVTMSAALLAAGLAQNSASAALATATTRVALAFAVSGRPTPAAAATSQAIALAEGVLRTMSFQTVRLVTALALALGLFAASVGVLTRPASSAHAEIAPAAKPEQAVPVAKPQPKASARENKTEAALQAGLQWLVRQQAKDGHWSLDSGATVNDVAGTAFGLLPLLYAGETHKGVGGLHPYTRNVDRGLRYLVRVQKADGDFGAGMYAHALAALALCEAYKQTTDPALMAPAQRALDYIVKAQHEAGGWRYQPGQPGDTSVSSWHILALQRGQAAKLKVPKSTSERAGAFLDSVAAPDGSAYSYVGRGPGSPAMTAAGVLCRQRLGWGPRHPGLAKGIAALKQQPPNRAMPNLYYYHHATLALAAAGGEDWKFWEPKMRLLLLETQDHGQDQANFKGSWSPEGNAQCAAGGRLMATALALIILQTCAAQDAPLPLDPPGELNAKDVERLWSDLAGDEFFRARQGMRTLAAVPAQTLPFLTGVLKPAPAVDRDRIVRLIAELDDAKFAVREQAALELKQMGELTEFALRKALQGQNSLEARRRIELLLDSVERLEVSPERLRVLRAMEVLVQIGTPAASRLLEGLAQGAPEARLTREARTALDRLAKRPAASP